MPVDPKKPVDPADPKGPQIDIGGLDLEDVEEIPDPGAAENDKAIDLEDAVDPPKWKRRTGCGGPETDD